MTISDNIAGIQTRHNMDDTQCAEYLGVNIHTFRNWKTGKRVPCSAVDRLLVVLGTIEALNPALHDHFMPDKG